VLKFVLEDFENGIRNNPRILIDKALKLFAFDEVGSCFIAVGMEEVEFKREDFEIRDAGQKVQVRGIGWNGVAREVVQRKVDGMERAGRERAIRRRICPGVVKGKELDHFKADVMAPIDQWDEIGKFSDAGTCSSFEAGKGDINSVAGLDPDLVPMSGRWQPFEVDRHDFFLLMSKIEGPVFCKICPRSGSCPV
jgi:hypothetical protein